MFKNRFLLNLVLVSVLFAGVLSIIACGPGGGENSEEAAYNFTISVAADTTYDYPDPVTGGFVYHTDYIIQVRDAAGKPVNGVKVKILAHGTGINSFYTDNTFATPITDPFYRVTDENGVILVNYNAGPFTSGTDEATYTYGFRVQSGGIESVHTDTVTVPATTPPLAISTAAILPDGTVGTVYSTTLTATGGTSPYTWALTSGSLPSGLILSGDSIIGTPTTAGTSLFEVTVTESAATPASVSKTFSLTIVP